MFLIRYVYYATMSNLKGHAVGSIHQSHLARTIQICPLRKDEQCTGTSGISSDMSWGHRTIIYSHHVGHLSPSKHPCSVIWLYALVLGTCKAFGRLMLCTLGKLLLLSIFIITGDVLHNLLEHDGCLFVLFSFVRHIVR